MPKMTFPRAGLPHLTAILSEIRVIEPDEGLLWWPAHLKSGVVSPLDEVIATAIARKSAIASSYEWRGAEERLLLLVAEGRGLTDVVGGAPEMESCRPASTPFTWILVWDRFSEDIWSVSSRYAVICDGQRQRRNLELLPKSLQRFSDCQAGYPTRLTRRYRFVWGSRQMAASSA